MKAVVCTRYGPPEVLQVREVSKPAPKDSDVLVRIHATTVQVGDVRARAFTFAPWIWLPLRLVFGLTKPRKTIPGSEFAGEVEAVGRAVRRFKPGDEVFGSTWEMGFGGACAEFKCVQEDGMLARKPTSASYEEAAALVESSLSALHFLRRGNVGPGKTVLIVGASGAVGTAAVQLAKHLGAEVTGVCSTRNLDLVRSLGADHVIDYTQEDFTESGQRYDVIFDTVIKTSFPRCRDSLVEGGVYLTDDWPLLWALWTSLVGSKKVIFGVAPKRTEDLVFLRDLVETEKLRPVVDSSYPLEQIVEAHRHVESGHKRGAVVVTVQGGD